ncbi:MULTISPECIES: ComF family protein [Dyella]|uniref:ComF family protein n=2 Tax=Dyella TaxID=231454 RepID=A0A4R0YDR0_9GAMM|nr:MULTISPECIES: ComF family protein [Dyella]TBR36044.1 ComF family protein [Dyella terrae]TCI06093.1 ComF family protein [Dyella soli]
MDALVRLAQWATTWLIPWQCLLCKAPGDGMDLCTPCQRDMPLNQSCCARCALPLPLPTDACGECLRKTPPWHAAWVPFRYDWPMDRLESRFKFGRDLAAGRCLSTLWLQQAWPTELPKAIVPVPLSTQRLRHRGYNQALELARPLAKAMGVPLMRDVLRRTRPTSAQTDLARLARRKNVRGAFQVRHGTVLPAHVALVDDVMTTGATLAECARCLRRAGVKRVDVWAVARAAGR